MISILAACASLLLLSVGALSEGKDEFDTSPDLSGLKVRWAKAMQAMDVPGMSVAIVKQGEVLDLISLGVRDLHGEPVTPDTLFYIASATKPFVAMVAKILEERGDLDTEDPIVDYLPRFELADKAQSDRITIRDLMCHRPGLNHGLIVWQDAYTGQITEDVYYSLLKEVEAPGRLEYSNVHFTLVGRVIEAVTEQSWKDRLQELIFDPAGMTRTTAYASRMYSDSDVATPMLKADGKWIRSPLVKTDRTMHAAGGMGTTARDVARWMILNIDRGEIDGVRILDEDRMKEMQSLQASFEKPNGTIRVVEGFGLGWQFGSYRSSFAPLLMHGGGYVGAASIISFLPEQGLGVAVLCNTSGNGSRMTQLVQIDVLDRLLGVTDGGDLLPNYLSSAEKEETLEIPEGENPGKATDGLSLGADAYVGLYLDDRRGALEVRLDGEDLELGLGDLSLRLRSESTDRFGYWIAPGMEGQGRFFISEGRVDSVELIDDGGDLLKFDRRDTGH